VTPGTSAFSPSIAFAPSPAFTVSAGFVGSPKPEPTVPVGASSVIHRSEDLAPSKQLPLTARLIDSETPEDSSNLELSVQYEPSAVVPASAAAQASGDWVDSRGFEMTDGLVSQPIEASSNLDHTVELSKSLPLDETGGFAGTYPIIETAGLNETEGFETTKTYAASQVFSPSDDFTAHPRSAYGRRSIMNLSGYLFFVFFFGDGQ
jgi:hypothetical protein